jgi:hypothetical protein
MIERNPFVTGGPVPEDSPVYVEREADRKAAQKLNPQLMKYIALIEPHQQGKTSMIWRLVNNLSQGYCWVYVDLSCWTEPMPPAKWFAALEDWILKRIQERYHNVFHLFDSLSSNLRWPDFLEALAKQASVANVSLIIALDEATAVPEECAYRFFQPMRSIYNCRMTQPYYKHISFIIACAYDPTLLIEDSPVSNALNVFQNIDIDDFTLDEVQRLVECLPNLVAEDEKAIAERLYYWCDGHPFLAQWFCATLFEGNHPPTSAGVDRAVQSFMQSSDQHLQNIVKKLDTYSGLYQFLEDILGGEQIAFYPSADPKIKALQLVGFVKADSRNFCKIRNRLYERLLQSKSEPPPERLDKPKSAIEDFDQIQARVVAIQSELCTIEEKFEDREMDMDEYLRLRSRAVAQRGRQLARLQCILTESGVPEMDLALEKLKTDRPDEAVVKQELELAVAEAEQKGWGQHLLEQIEAHRGDLIELAVAIAVKIGKAAAARI